jgi:RNA-binding protein
MQQLTSAQRKYLRAKAHHLDPVVMVGKKGLTDELIGALDQALESHELVKLRFQDCKDEKEALLEDIMQRTGCAMAGLIGHVAILFRQQQDSDKQRYDLPE